MLERVVLAAFLCTLWSCGSSSTSPGSDPGPLVDNTQWVPTTDGEAFFDAPPDDAECALMPIDCPEFPWPEGECVTLDATSTCIASFVPECWLPFTVMAVYTRMPNPTIPLCNWITLEQPSLRDIRAGDHVEVRMRHAELTAPVPNGFARVMFAIGDQVVVDHQHAIPWQSEFFPRTLNPQTGEFEWDIWVADRDYPEGTQLLFHIENHGANEYMLIEVNVL